VVGYGIDPPLVAADYRFPGEVFPAPASLQQCSDIYQAYSDAAQLLKII
jgi:hypothetical protein